MRTGVQIATKIRVWLSEGQVAALYQMERANA